MQITYTRTKNFGSQSESLTITDSVQYGDQVEDTFNRIRFTACKALNVLPYEETREGKLELEKG